MLKHHLTMAVEEEITPRVLIWWHLRTVRFKDSITDHYRSLQILN
jgi:hypothetical protein